MTAGAPPAMKPILQNLVEMTGHRDHLRLEVSVLSTLQSVSGILQVRSLEIFQDGGQLHYRPRTWLGANGQWMSAGVEAASDPQRRPVADDLPALHACLQDQSSSAVAVLGKGRHGLWLPVWMNEKVHTCLEVIQNRPFSAQKIDTITHVFQVFRNYQSLLDYSERDALTGLLNRKTFDEQFSRSTFCEVAVPMAQELSLPVDEAGEGPDRQWLAVIDIDHFKMVNDRFGHLYGDEVLILLANILRSSFRSHDRIFRFGGEEFVVLLRSTSLAKAHKVFNRFRKNVEDHYFPQVGQVTVSVGFVAAESGSPVEALGRADQALYFAKENGRNQVRYYDDLLAAGLLQTKQVSNDDVELF